MELLFGRAKPTKAPRGHGTDRDKGHFNKFVTKYSSKSNTLKLLCNALT